MNSIAKRDMENNKSILFGLLLVLWLISFITNMVYSIYPTGLEKKDNRQYINAKLKNINQHKYDCNGIYNAISAKFMSLGVVFIFFLLINIQLILTSKVNQQFLIMLIFYTLIIMLSIGYTIWEIDNKKEHILVFKDNNSTIQLMSWFLQIILFFNIIFFYDNIFNKELFEGQKKWEYLLYTLNIALFVGIIILHFNLKNILANVTDEKLCSALNY